MTTTMDWNDLARQTGKPPDIQALAALATPLGAPPKPIAPEAAPEDAKAERKSTATRMVELVRSRCQLWRSDGDPYVTIVCGGHREHHKLTDKSGRLAELLRAMHYDAEGQAAGANAVRDAIQTLAGVALYDADSADFPTACRVAHHRGAVYLDLCDDEWRCVEVRADGWKVVNDPPVRFLRRGAMRALPVPELGGSLAEIRRFVRFPDRSWPLVAGWLVGTLSPGGYPLLVLRGSHGTGKSTVAKLLRSVVDPSKAELRSEPREQRDLVTTASASWVLAYDNLSHVPQWLSDGLCCIATGGGYSARALYSDLDEVVIDVKRPIVLTGISDVVNRPDLLDRSLLVELERIPETERRTEKQIQRDWEAAKPKVLGALLTAVSMALRDVDKVQLSELPRLADWARWVTAAEPAMGLEQGAVLASLRGTRTEAIDIALDSSAIGSPIRSLVESGAEWRGTMGELLRELARLAGDGTKAAGWPRTVQALNAELTRITAALRDDGIEVDRMKREGADRKRVLVIRRVRA